MMDIYAVLQDWQRQYGATDKQRQYLRKLARWISRLAPHAWGSPSVNFFWGRARDPLLSRVKARELIGQAIETKDMWVETNDNEVQLHGDDSDRPY